MASDAMQVLHGMGVSDGIAIGRAVCIETRGPEVFRFTLPEEQVESEVDPPARGRPPCPRASCSASARGPSEDLGNDLAAIFDAHVLLLSDPTFLGRVEERIRTHQVNAEWAVHKTAEELDDRFAHIDDPYLRERSEDLTDVSRHLLRSLQGIAHHDLSELPEDVVIVADDLTPSDAIRLGREQVIGFAIESGGRTSPHHDHRPLAQHPGRRRPAGDHRRRLTRRGAVIVDGETGRVILHPTAEVLAEYRARAAEIERRERELLATRELAAVTRDGVEIQLMANIDLPEEVDEVPRSSAPPASASTAASSSTSRRARSCRPRRSTSRSTAGWSRSRRPTRRSSAPTTWAGASWRREMMATREENPVLGLRGIRLTLRAAGGLPHPAPRALPRRALRRPLDHAAAGQHRRGGAAVPRLRRRGDGRARSARDCPSARDVRLGVMIEVPGARR